MIRSGFLVCVALAVAAPLFAQDTVPPREGVRVGITYQPGVRPGLLVLEGPADARLDSIRTILRRDLDYSDQFEVITLPPDDSTELGIGSGAGGEFVNYGLYAALGADFTVRVRGGDSLTLFVYDVRSEAVRRTLPAVVPPLDDPGFRMAVHRLSDDVVRAVTGQGGIAATRFLFLQRGRIYRIDADGADLVPVTPAGVRTFSPAWSPDGRRVAYTEFHDQGGRLYIQDLETGRRQLVGTTDRGLNYTPMFSPDGRTLVFSRSDEGGTDIYAYDADRNCCLQRLTVGRFADNLSPTFSPDGRRIAFELQRPDPTFPNKLALLFAAPFPREAGTGDKAALKVASGPYRVESYVPRRSIVLVRNPNATEQGYVDRMDIRIGVSVENAYAMLRHGELDAVIGDAPPSQLFRFRRDPRWKPNAFLRRFPDMTWVVMNTTVEPFDDPRVRSAVCYAIDPRAIVKAVLGIAVVPKGLLPSSVPGYEPGLPCDRHDPAKARRLLAEAGLPDGFDTALYAYNVNPFPRMAEALQAMLGEAGIRMEIRVVDGSVWDGVVGKRETKPPMVMSEWIASLPDPSDWLDNNFSPFRLRAKSNTNLTEWDTPRARALFRAASEALDPRTRADAYHAAGREVVRESIAVPIAEGLAFNVVGARVRGFVFHPIWGPLLSKLWLVRP